MVNTMNFNEIMDIAENTYNRQTSINEVLASESLARSEIEESYSQVRTRYERLKKQVQGPMRLQQFDEIKRRIIEEQQKRESLERELLEFREQFLIFKAESDTAKSNYEDQLLAKEKENAMLQTKMQMLNQRIEALTNSNRHLQDQNSGL